MQIERILSRGQLVGLQFMQADIAASQTDVQLSVAAVDNAADDQLEVDGYVMPFAGRIVGISARLSAAASAGSLTAGPTINGTEQTDPTLSITTEQSKSDTAPREVTKFAKDDLIGAEITTSGTWNGTTADLVVTVWVVLEVEGI